MALKLIIAIIVTLGTSCLLCKCQEQSDQFSELNKYLQIHTKTDYFDDNQEAIIKWSKTETVGSFDLEFQKLAKLFASLSTTSVCQSDNIHNLAQTISVALSIDREAFAGEKRERRLSQLLLRYVDNAADCYRTFEHNWRTYARPDGFKKDYEANLSKFDALNRDYALLRNADDDLKLFDGAVRRVTQSNQSGKSALTSADVVSVLLKLERTLKASMPLFGGRTLTTDEARELLDQDLMGPCDSLLKRKESISYLRPFAEMGLLIEINGDIKSDAGYPVMQALEWASRYMLCEQLLWMNKDQLVEDLSKNLFRKR